MTVAALVVPIAHDLEETPDGDVECGIGTKNACNHAVEVASRIRDSAIFLCAGYSEDYDVIMACVMAKYLTTHAPHLPLRGATALEFNTLGELIAVATYVKSQRESEKPARVIFTVKDWHAARVKTLAREVFKLFGLSSIPLAFEEHESPGGRLEKHLEPLKTCHHLLLLYSRYWRGTLVP